LTHLDAGASVAGNGDGDVGSVGDKTQLLPPPGDGRKNLGCVWTLDGAVMLGEGPVLRALWCCCNSS